MLAPRLADTLLGARESWTRRMFEQAAKLRADGGGPVFDLSLGNPSLEPPPRFLSALGELLMDTAPGQHRYMTNAGFEPVRAFVAAREAKRFDLPIEACDIVMTVGAAGGLNVVLRAMLAAHEEVVAPVPYFTEYDHYLANADGVLVGAASRSDFSLDVDAVAAKLTAKTRIVLINSPNNPSGAVYTEAELDGLAAALTEANAGRDVPVFVVEDSPYRNLMHDGSQAASMMSRYAHCIHLTSHSKDLGLAGERIGYIVISPRAYGRSLLARAFAFNNRVLGFVNAPALMQRMLPKVLGHSGGCIDVSIYARRCKEMADGLSALGFGVVPPRAGFFLFPRLPEALRDETGGDIALTRRLQDERTIVVPGTAFGIAGHLRLSLAAPDEAVAGALAAFRRVCD